MSLRPARAVLLLIAVATGLRLALAGLVDLGLDEAYALAVSRQFQLSWFDHPPMAFWIAGAMQAVFGLEVPSAILRLPFILLSAATTGLLYAVTARHFDERAGLWAAFLFTIGPFFFLSAGSWVVPDGPLVFALMLAAWALTPIVLDDRAEGHWSLWLVAGLALGLALLSKYHAALFALGALAYFVLHPGLRTWLRRPQPYIAVLLALVLCTPVIVWNAQNEWASFAFQLGRGTAVGSSSAAIITRLFLTEAAYLLPTTALLLVASLVWLLLKWPAPRQSMAFFAALGLPIIVGLDANRFWTWQAYAHWSMPGWMLLLPLVGAMLVAAQRRWRLTGPVVLSVSLLQFAAVVIGVTVLLSDWRIPNAGVDAFRVEAGSWTGVAAGVREAQALDGVGFVVARRWSEAARVAEALRAPLPTLVMEPDGRGFDWLVDPEALVGKNALLVLRPGETDQLMARYADYFNSFEPVGTFPVEPGNPAMMQVTRARNLLRPWPDEAELAD